MTKTMSRRSRVVRWVLNVGIVCATVLTCWLIVRPVFDFADAARATTLKREMGFEYGTHYRAGREVFVIERVVPGRAMAKAGAKSGDAITGYSSVLSFSRDLWTARGSTFEFTVERGGRIVRLKVAVPHIAEGKM